MKRQLGYSFVELMVVVGIIGVLASSAVAYFPKARCKAKTSDQLATLQAMKNKIDACLLLNRRVPNICSKNGSGGYDCDQPVQGKIQYCMGTPIDCFAITNPEFTSMMEEGKVCYIGGEDGNKGGGNNAAKCDVDNPSQGCLTGLYTYVLKWNEPSCFEGMTAWVSNNPWPAQLIETSKLDAIY